MIKHTVTIVFHTDAPITPDQEEVIQEVVEDMRAQLEILSDMMDESGNWVGLDYSDTSVDYKREG